MESLLGFKLDFWDYATFAVLMLLVLAGLITVVWLAGLPGRIAIARKLLVWLNAKARDARREFANAT